MGDMRRTCAFATLKHAWEGSRANSVLLLYECTAELQYAQVGLLPRVEADGGRPGGRARQTPALAEQVKAGPQISSLSADSGDLEVGAELRLELRAGSADRGRRHRVCRDDEIILCTLRARATCS